MEYLDSFSLVESTSCTRYASLASGGVSKNLWSSSATVCLSSIVGDCQEWGLFLQVERTVATLEEFVAVKSKDCRLSGRAGIMVDNCPSKFPSSRRSASSRTRYFSLLRLKVELFSMWSASLPGVADLKSKFSCWSEDEGVDAIGVFRERLQDRNNKCKGFSLASLGNAQTISSCQDGWDTILLDGSWLQDSKGRKLVSQPRHNPQLLKAGVCHV